MRIKRIIVEYEEECLSDDPQNPWWFTSPEFSKPLSCYGCPNFDRHVCICDMPGIQQGTMCMADTVYQKELT